MLISMSVLLFCALHLMFLIAVIYMIIFLRMHYSVRLSGLDALLTMLQTINLIFLLQHIVGYEGGFLTANKNYDLLFAVQGLFIFLLLIRFVWLLRKMRTHRQKLLIPQSIRETIDYLPGGISFSTMEGKPVLTNYRMNELVHRLSDHTIINARTTWEELRLFDSANGCVKLADLCMNQAIDETAEDCMYFLLPDRSIWRFRKEKLTDRFPHYTQLEATEISDLYRYSEELFENNKRLAEQYERQQNLLANIVEINHEREILSTKMRIHDELGRSILTTKQHLTNQTLFENISYLAEIWNNTIRSLTDFTKIDIDSEVSPEIELRKAANMIGCQIVFDGGRPADRKTSLLFYASVREALTNAVKHAKADQLTVTIKLVDQRYHVEISDNGAMPVSDLTEGSGLSNLRRRLEQEGATLQIKCEGGVVLIVTLPTERIDQPAQEERSEW